jgi:hypothetical protein
MRPTFRLAAARALAPLLLAFAAVPAVAVPVTVGLSNLSFTIVSGYGIDGSEKAKDAPTLLDVVFAGGAAPATFTLQAAGESVTLDLGTVTLREASEHGGILPDETDDLWVTASFSLSQPVSSPFAISTRGIATGGSVSDADPDLKIQWAPVFVGFGDGGLLSILLNELSFTAAGPLTQTATVALVSALADPVPPLPQAPDEPLPGAGSGTAGSQLPAAAPAEADTVPEPGSLVLAALALMALPLVRRARPAC